jgi:hypothetical protein
MSTYQSKTVKIKDNATETEYIFVYSLNDGQWTGRVVCIDAHDGNAVTFDNAEAVELQKVRTWEHVERLVYMGFHYHGTPRYSINDMKSGKLSSTMVLAILAFADKYRQAVENLEPDVLPDFINLIPFRSGLDAEYAKMQAHRAQALGEVKAALTTGAKPTKHKDES